MSDNPPAFPNDARIQLGDDYQGMTLRDYFAGHALSGVVDLITVSKPETYKFIANLSYKIADAMLEARKVQS